MKITVAILQKSKSKISRLIIIHYRKYYTVKKIYKFNNFHKKMLIGFIFSILGTY
ncbi:MAG: hypothetical protein ACI815_000027 [Psychroserpens sp.]|jgi:hypothetical protein